MFGKSKAQKNTEARELLVQAAQDIKAGNKVAALNKLNTANTLATSLELKEDILVGLGYLAG
jgi:hypothetical protein